LDAPAESPRRLTAALAGLGLAALLAYANTFTVPFCFDDLRSIVDNPALRDLRDWRALLVPPSADGATVGGRPLLHLSLALNHALSGQAVWSYHAANLAIHVLAAFALFGVARRTLGRTPFARHAFPAAWFTALLWALHPLQTESVTYIVQRAESLCGLLYLCALYAFIRGTAPGLGPRGGPWLVASVAAAWLGAATKEVMATAPLVILLYDRAFVAGTFRAAWQARRGYYLALAATWLLLAALVLSTSGRGGTAGTVTGLSPWAYLASQPLALAHYLRLIVWPFPLLLDHGGSLTYAGPGQALACAALAAALLAGTVAALARSPRLGWVAAWFVVILAPSSSIVPLLDTLFEHRLYLALAAPVAGLVLLLLTRLGPVGRTILILTAVAAGSLTFARNATYRDAAGLWRDNARHQPGNARVRFELGNVLLRQGQAAEAAAEFRRAITLRPEYLEVRHNLGAALLRTGALMDAVVAFEATLRLRPLARTHFALATTYAALGRIDDALGQYEATLRLDQADADARNNRANILLQKGDAPQALAEYQEVLRRQPGHLDARLNAASALITLLRPGQAADLAREAVRLRPDYAAAHWKLGDALLESSRPAEAVAPYETALRLDPSLVPARHNLARSLELSDRLPEALSAYEATVKLAPGWALGHHNYALALERAGRLPEAVAQNDAALRLQPDLAEALNQRARLRQPAPTRR
jgi:tetratricopeptide (TPR) repeat protein